MGGGKDLDKGSPSALHTHSSFFSSGCTCVLGQKGCYYITNVGTRFYISGTRPRFVACEPESPSRSRSHKPRPRRMRYMPLALPATCCGEFGTCRGVRNVPGGFAYQPSPQTRNRKPSQPKPNLLSMNFFYARPQHATRNRPIPS